MITAAIKQQVVNALLDKRKMFAGSDKNFAVSLGIDKAQFSRIKNGELDGVISDASYITLARRLEVSMGNAAEWNTAKTNVFITVSTWLEKCQNDSISAMLCDDADIGKTYSAKVYVKGKKNAIYIDCSQVKSKQKLVRQIAKEFGVNHTGKYQDVYCDLTFYIGTLSNPLIILDEAGDLQYDAFLELKALWNATERCCGWFMMGADGLKEKIRRAIDCKKVGFTEIFSRYGKRYQRITPQGREEAVVFTNQQAALIIQANAPSGTDVKKMLVKTEGSLRRIYTEISKLKKAA